MFFSKCAQIEILRGLTGGLKVRQKMMVATVKWFFK